MLKLFGLSRGTIPSSVINSWLREYLGQSSEEILTKFFKSILKISNEQFSKDGPEIFINSNAFIKNSFSKIIYPTIQSLSIEIYNNGYLNEYLKDQFIKKFSNLNDIYVISDFSVSKISTSKVIQLFG